MDQLLREASWDIEDKSQVSTEEPSQARDYALSLGAPFVLLSNGREHYFGEYDTGDARPVVGFSSRADLERRANLRQHRAASLQHSLNALPLPTRFRFQGEPGNSANLESALF